MHKRVSFSDINTYNMYRLYEDEVLMKRKCFKSILENKSSSYSSETLVCITVMCLMIYPLSIVFMILNHVFVFVIFYGGS